MPSFLDPGARALREGTGLIAGPQGDLARSPARAAGRLEGGGSGVATSNDLGYTYGAWRRPAESRRGWFLRPWRRAPAEGWTLVLDLAMPAPQAP